ncbi:hypothetical protein C7293_18175 [filamentous cyanobacterium CCT1]|nr:hypothetical protein C7293_18175 [filamentous cyanobacterium CCT1]PSN77414.1 hypothetical protein C8B47_22145 [filamentous cyanobacterium CCP4]
MKRTALFVLTAAIAATTFSPAFAAAYSTYESGEATTDKVDFDKLREENRDKVDFDKLREANRDKVDFDKLREENRDKVDFDKLREENRDKTN